MTGMIAAANTDVLVIGGGPAGSTIALRLAALGLEVVLVERCEFPRRRIGESVPPTVLPLLDRLGVRDRMQSSKCVAEVGAVIRWAGVEMERGQAPGLVVDRAGFDDVLLDAARRSGVRVLQPGTILNLRRSDGGQGWQANVLRDGRTIDILSRSIVIAAGRRGGFGGRHRRRSPATLALHAYWHRPGPHTATSIVEAGEQHWSWAASLPDGTINVAIFCAPDHPEFRTTDDLAVAYRSFIARSRFLPPLLSRAQAGRVEATDASRQIITPVIDGTLLRVGDAAFSIDPLAAQGTFQAMVSAFQGAAIVNTLLRRPFDAPAAESFAHARQEEAVARDHQLAGEYYRRQADACEDPFWTSRAAGASSGFRDHETGAFRSLPAPDTPVQLCRNAALRPVPVLVDDYIGMSPALIHASLERPMAFWMDVPIGPLLASFGETRQLGAVLSEWSRRMPSRLAFRLVDTLWRKRIVIASGQEDNRSNAPISAATS